LLAILRRSRPPLVTPKYARKVDKTQLTQVGRALSQLGITHIPSYSPQGRGLTKRVLGTLQKRPPQDLRLARIKTVAAANRDGFANVGAHETTAGGPKDERLLAADHSRGPAGNC
jgi:hypothetical protein